MSDLANEPYIGQAFQVLWEQQVLAGCLYDREFSTEAAAELSTGDFGSPAHQIFFAGVQSLVAAGDMVTPSALAGEVTKACGPSDAWQPYLDFLLSALGLDSGAYQQAARNLWAAKT